MSSPALDIGSEEFVCVAGLMLEGEGVWEISDGRDLSAEYELSQGSEKASTECS